MATDPTIPRLVKYDEKNGVVRRRWLSTWYDAQGVRRSKQFGWESDTPQKVALRRYEAWKLKYAAKRRLRVPTGKSAPFTVTRLAAKYLRFARTAYVKHGERTTHVGNVKLAMRAIRDAWGKRLAADIEAPDLATLRDAMVYRTDQRGQRVPRSIKTVNGRLKIIVQAFEHAREYGFVTRDVVADLRSVKRLRKGRTDAKPARKIKSAPADSLVAASEVMPAVVKAIVDLLRITGMRSSEPCIMRGCDLVTNSPEATGLWEYRPSRHKLEHLGDPESEDDGSERIIFLGPKAQEIIRPFLRPDTTAYLFSPRDAYAERLRKKRADRKSKVQPSQVRRMVSNPTKHLGERYTHKSLRRAVLYACKKAGVKRFTPNQLRHTTATELQRKYGLDGSRVVLGHTSTETTLIYVDPDVRKAMQIAREVG